KIFFVRPDYWIVTDILTAEQEHRYALRFHLSAEAAGKTRSGTLAETTMIDSPDLVLVQPKHGNIEVQIETGYVSQYYGVKHAAPIITFTARGTNRQFHTVLFPYKKEKPQVALALLEVWRDGELCVPEEATALAIHIREGDKSYTDYFFTRHGDCSAAYRFGDFICDGAFGFVRVNAEGRVVRQYGEIRSMANTVNSNENISDAPVFTF
ncbi:MAG: heparinase II/III family protein, partial [bacterium]